MSAVGRGLAVAVCLTISSSAFAHPPPFGYPGFVGGLLHPAFVPAHFMALLGIGILIGQQSPQWGRAAPATVILALALGLSVLTLGVVPRWAGETVMVAALASGALAALGRPFPAAVGWMLAAVTGMAVGLDSPPEVLSLREANLMLIGTALGGTVLLVMVVEIASRLTHPWQRIGARILGSWIAASAILVLALRFFR
jgi:urease accessory protein